MGRRVQTYDREHQLTRERLLPGAYNTPCPRCGHLMLKGQELQLGHTVDAVIDPSSKGDRIEHANCNESAGGKLGAQRLKFKPSRSW